MKATKLLISFLITVTTLLAFGHVSSAATSFKDISTSYRAYNEIIYLGTADIVSGDTKGNFQPNRNVTRGEAVAMLGRAIGLDGTKTSTNFSDVGSQNFASGYIKAAAAKGIVTGNSDGSFKPNQKINRGEMAVLISRAFNYNFDGSVSGAATALKTRGIAQGLSNGTFGENNDIVRADFAIFLARAIDYTLRLTPTTAYDGTKYVQANSLHVRKGPSTKYATVGTLARNVEVQTSYSVGNWTLVKAGGTVGFVNSGYLSGEISTGESGIVDSSNSLSDLTIVIDPGHGAHDIGAAGYGSLNEKDVVLDTGLRVQSLLNNTPFNVIMTRSTDIFHSLSARAVIANKANADIFVSIHANGFNGKANGSETFYYGKASTNSRVEESKKLAGYIQVRLLEAMGTKDRGVKPGNYAVIRETTMPAVLVELGFIDNKDDYAKLSTTTYRQKAAEAIYYGILDYYKVERKYEVSSYYR